MARRRKYSQLYSFGSPSVFQTRQVVEKHKPKTSVDRIPKEIPDCVSLVTIRRQHRLRNGMSYRAFCEYICLVLIIERGYLSLRDLKLLAQTCKTLNCLITSDYIYSCSSEYFSKGLESLMPDHIYQHKRFDSKVVQGQYYSPSKRFRKYSYYCESYKEKKLFDDIDDSDIIYRWEDLACDDENEEDDYYETICKLKNLSIYHVSTHTYQIKLI